jgi:hypothetical protein
MATWTREQVASRALELVGVMPPASAEDQLLAESAVDFVLMDLGRQQVFDSSAVPDWAYIPIAKICASELSPFFHLGSERVAILGAESERSKKAIDRATSFLRHPVPIQSEDF